MLHPLKQSYRCRHYIIVLCGRCACIAIIFLHVTQTWSTQSLCGSVMNLPKIVTTVYWIAIAWNMLHWELTSYRRYTCSSLSESILRITVFSLFTAFRSGICSAQCLLTAVFSVGGAYMWLWRQWRHIWMREHHRDSHHGSVWWRQHLAVTDRISDPGTKQSASALQRRCVVNVTDVDNDIKWYVVPDKTTDLS